MARAKKAAVVEVEPVEEVTATPIAPSAIEMVALGRLIRAPENVRHTRAGEDVEGLADDIAAKGLLQSLIGYAGDTDVDARAVYIVGGGRRLQALQLLRERDRIDYDFPVPVLIRTEGEAVELSLSENLQQRTMSPVDEFFAFKMLMDRGGHSTADLAKRFGFSERVVKQRLRLADLADDVLDALRQREITLDAAMAYASTQDRALQSAVFGKQGKVNRPHEPSGIRWALAEKVLTTKHRQFLFVGAEAYEAAGGRYEDDLFRAAEIEPDDDRPLADRAIVEQLAREKIDHMLGQRMIELAAKLELKTLDGLWVIPNLELPEPYHVMSPEPKAADGYEFVHFAYNPDRFERCLKTVRNNGISVKLVVGIDREGKLGFYGRGLYVIKDQVEAVTGKAAKQAEQTDYAAVRAERGAQYQVEQRAERVRGRAAVLAALAIAQPDPSMRRIFVSAAPKLGSAEQLPGVGEVYSVAQKFFVTPAEIEAQLEAAEAWVAEAEREGEEKAAALEARVQQLLAMDPQPAVITVDDLDYFRW
jgi:ParB/RepB/Spo0J family partition protein